LPAWNAVLILALAALIVDRVDVGDCGLGGDPRLGLIGHEGGRRNCVVPDRRSGEGGAFTAGERRVGIGARAGDEAAAVYVAVAMDVASRLAPWAIAVADAVPRIVPPLPPVADALDVTEVVPTASLVAVTLPPAARGNACRLDATRSSERSGGRAARAAGVSLPPAPP
jgi:hypothetical protein